MSNGRNSSHSKALEEICKKTNYYLGIKPRDILTDSKEQNLIYRGSHYLQPDIVLELKSGLVVLIEYKSCEENSLVEKGREQLKKAMIFYETFLGKKTRGFLIVEDKILDSGDLGHFNKPYKKISNKKDYRKNCL